MKDAGTALSRISELLADDGVVYVQTFVEDPSVNERIDIAVLSKLGHRVFRGDELNQLAVANGLRIENAARAGMVYFCTLGKAVV